MTNQKGSILTKPDYDEMRRVVREDVAELKAIRVDVIPAY